MMAKKILYLLLAALLVIQFIRPARNLSEKPSANHISNKYAVPADISGILQNSCYDCHSNNTRYPWYANLQPVAWWLQDHVNEGKRELNFDEFLTYPPRKAHHKLEEVIEMVKEEEMPLGSYTFVHRNSRLSAEQRKLLSDWAAGTMQEIASANDISPKEKR
jgi:hypothetical protein